MSGMTPDLRQVFARYFEMVHANTEDLRESAYRLRYQVYVVETGFERAEDHPNGLERDVYDARSDHFLLRHRRSGLFAATVRVILPDPAAVMEAFPLERHCPLYPDQAITDPASRLKLGEVSRFAVSKEFKRRLGEAGTSTGLHDNDSQTALDLDERRILPHISIGLFALWTRLMHMHGLTLCYGVMEPALHRLISRFGLIFHPIGPQVEYHGQRIPCLGDMHEILPNVKRLAPPLWDLMTDGGKYTCGSE